MKKIFFVLASLSVIASAQFSWAGCGAVACSNNANGNCVQVSGDAEGWPFDNRFDVAINDAVNTCNDKYGNCEAKKWECNACTDYVTAGNGKSIRACY